MDNEVVISVEGLGKRYTLGTSQKSERYTALRDVVANSARNLFRRKPSADASSNPEEFWALKEVSFEVRRGEVVGIIGRNGAGKSTLLKILSRITEPTRGRLEITGRVARLLEVGNGFHPELTGRENIFLNGAILGMHRHEIKAKFDEIVAFAEVEKFLDTPVKRYSSGMYVRLAFAVAAHLEPEILVVDEVLAVGDAAFQRKCLGKMQDVARGGGRTVLFVSHLMSSVASLCSQCVHLRRGSIENHGPVESVIASYIKEEAMPDDLAVRLDKRVRKTGNAGAQMMITAVSIKPADDQAVRYREALRVRLEVVAFIDIEECFLGIGVNGLIGERLFTVEGNETPLPLLKRGEKRQVEVVIPEPALTPGRYVLEVGANAGTGLGLDYVPEAMSFLVVPDTAEIYYSERIGMGLRPRSVWNYDLAH